MNMLYYMSLVVRKTVFGVSDQAPHKPGNVLYEPRCEKNGLRGFRPGPTQTRLCSHRRWLEACNFVFRKKRDCNIYIAKTKALISFAVSAKLICVFVFAYAKSWFSHDTAHIWSGPGFFLAYFFFFIFL